MILSLRRNGKSRYQLKNSSKRTGPWAACFIFALFLAISSLISGCATKAKIQDVNLSYPAVKRIVMGMMPLGVRVESPNGREVQSRYFSPRNWEDDATERGERAYAKVLILNSTRPYDIEVQVIREKKSGGKYKSLGPDERLTKQLTIELRQALADRREDHNVIDGFRAF